MPRLSIFGQDAQELADSDFIPLYFRLADGSVEARTPDSLQMVLTRRLLDDGKLIEASFMSKLYEACEDKMQATSLYVNANIGHNDSAPEGLISAVKSIGNFTGIPVGSVISTVIRTSFNIKHFRETLRANISKGDKINFRRHAIIFSYLFSLMVGKKFHHILTQEELMEIFKLKRQSAPLQLRDMPRSAINAFLPIIHSIVHVIQKDLAERTTALTSSPL